LACTIGVRPGGRSHSHVMTAGYDRKSRRGRTRMAHECRCPSATRPDVGCLNASALPAPDKSRAVLSPDVGPSPCSSLRPGNGYVKGGEE
jgi:hypothetical protein